MSQFLVGFKALFFPLQTKSIRTEIKSYIDFIFSYAKRLKNRTDSNRLIIRVAPNLKNLILNEGFI
jgi:hypothetical protein